MGTLGEETRAVKGGGELCRALGRKGEPKSSLTFKQSLAHTGSSSPSSQELLGRWDLSPHDQLTGSHRFLNLKKGPRMDSTASGITGVTETVSAQFQPLKGGAFLFPHSQSLLGSKDRSSATP